METILEDSSMGHPTTDDEADRATDAAGTIDDEGMTGEMDQPAEGGTPAKKKTVRIPADSSANTRWAQPAKRLRGDTIWHGYSYAGAYATLSYCGVKHEGVFRRSPPPRDAQVCERCAGACGFVRRATRVKGERQRGSRRLGSIVDRMEVALDRGAAQLERLGAAVDRLYDAMGGPKKGGGDD